MLRHDDNPNNIILSSSRHALKETGVDLAKLLQQCKTSDWSDVEPGRECSRSGGEHNFSANVNSGFEEDGNSNNSCDNISESDVTTRLLLTDNEQSASINENGSYCSNNDNVSSGSRIVGEEELNISELRRRTWLAVFLGQVLSVILCLSAVTSVYLMNVYDIHIPNAQNFVFYIALSAIFTTILACRSDSSNLVPVLKQRGWKYFLVALADAEGNYLVVKAYQYTTLTSVQLLDCFTIPTVLVLSWLLLRTRYNWANILGVGICLTGVCCLIWADIENGIPFGKGYERLLGDVLCLSGAFLYGVSNISQEFFVKTFDIVEFLGMVGLFGSIVTGLQAVLLEYENVTEGIIHGSPMPILLLLAFAVVQISFYLLAAFVIKLFGATLYNLSILTADFYSLIVGIYLFQYKFQNLYFLSFGFVIMGVIVFSIRPATTRSLHQTETTSN